MDSHAEHRDKMRALGQRVEDEGFMTADGVWNDELCDDYMEEYTLPIFLTYRGKSMYFGFFTVNTMADLIEQVELELSIPESNQKYMITPKVGTLKAPFDKDRSLLDLKGKKIVLLGASTLETSALQEQMSILAVSSSPSPRSNPIKSATPSRTRDWRKMQNESTYTFHTIRALDYLPNPSRSHKFLERLASDPGIKAAMTAHKFSVGLLTEMDPAMHTTHDSRTLGLNRNKGEVIELRLRTDAYDGYRDYKTIRKTLCHELAHNVWGEHDRNFYNLMQQIEKEVSSNDWTRGGKTVGEEEFYNPNDGGVPEGEHFDGGGWTGGEFVLGRGEGASASEGGGLSRREVLAKAAEGRAKKLGGKDGGVGGGPSGSGSA